MSKFIVISGKKGHGKNYFASVLSEYLRREGKTVVETAFAEPMKKFCNEVFGFSMEDMMSQEGKLKKTHIKWSQINVDIARDNNKMNPDYNFGRPVDEYMTIREVLQVIGTDVWRKRFYDPIWAEAPFYKKWDADYVIITDCRFPNELEIAKKHGAVAVRIVGMLPGMGSEDTHISETALDNWKWKKDEVFINNESGTQQIIDFIEFKLLGKLTLGH
jgi:hypothetical protein